MAIPSFVDRVTLHAYGGNGGHGCASVHREKFKPLGGPDGGNGGDGGSVILRVDPDLTTLVDYHRQSHRRATNGQPGRGDHQNGARGEDVVLRVPDGTVVTDDATGEQLADLTGTGTEVVVGHGWSRRSRQRRAGLGRPQGARLRPAGRRGRDPDHHPRAQGGGRRRPGRLPQRRQVLPGRGHLPGPAQDRRLPVHHPGAQPRRRGGRRRHLHRRRRARADRGRERGPRAGLRLPPPHRALRGAGARDRLRDLPARPRPGQRPRGDRGRAGRPRRAGGPAAGGRPEQDRRARRRRAGRARGRRAERPGLAGLPDLHQDRRGSARADLRDGRAGRRPPRGRAAARAAPDRDPARGRCPVGRSSPSRRRARSGGYAETSRSAGSRRPTSATPRPSATWPTG